MKKQFIIVLFLFFCFSSFSQSYKTIHKAEKAIDQKNYDKALRLLDKAEKQDYGFCGTAWLEAKIMITELRFRAYKEKGDKNELEKLLNEVNPFFEFNNSYSKERLALALDTYTKDEIDTRIKQALLNYKEDAESFGSNIISIKISEQDILKLFFEISDVYTIMKGNKLTLNDALIKYYEQTEYYVLLH